MIPSHPLRGSTTSSHGRRETEPAIPARGRLTRRMMAAARDVMLVAILVAPAIGLAWRVSRDGGRQGEVEAANGTGSGIIVREEVLRLWMPRSLCEFAGLRHELADLSTHKELRHWLLARNEQDLWYGVTSRGHQVNGQFADRTVIRHPFHDAAHFEELLAVLATAGGNPPRSPHVDFSTATVQIIPDGMRNLEPREAMVELLGRSSPPVDRERP